MMRIEQAIKILKREREFLGISWEDLFILCRAESSALKLAALDAYDSLIIRRELVEPQLIAHLEGA